MEVSSQNSCHQTTEMNERNGKNAEIFDSQSEKNDHSTSEMPLIRCADDAVNIMKNAERHSFTDTQTVQSRSKNRLKKQRRLYITIAFLAVILLIALISIILLLIDRNLTSLQNGSSKSSLIYHKATTTEPAVADDTAPNAADKHHNPSPPELVHFIRDGLNSSISPCHDFYGHVCSNHNSSSYDLLVKHFYHLIISAIRQDKSHPKVAKTLLHCVEECAKVNRSSILRGLLQQHNIDSFDLPPFRSKMVDKNFNFMVPLVRIFFHSPIINISLLHNVFFINSTISFYGDPESSLVAYKDSSPFLTRELESMGKFYNLYMSLFNMTKNEEELMALRRFVLKFHLICAESVISGSVWDIKIKNLHNDHFKEAIENILPYVFRLGPNITAEDCSVSVDLSMIRMLQQLFESHPKEGLLFLHIFAVSAFRKATPAIAKDTWDSLRQLCFFGILSAKEFAIFNLYAAMLVQRSDLPMTQVRDQMLVRNIVENIRRTIRAKLSATVWLQTDRELVKSLDGLMGTKKVIGLPEVIYAMSKAGGSYEIDRFEHFLSLHNSSNDVDLLIHLATSRLYTWEGQLYFGDSAWYDGETIEIPYLRLQRPFYSPQYPASYNYGFIGKTAGHELFHQFTPDLVRDFWKNNTSVECYAKFYNGICFNLTLHNDTTNSTRLHEICAKGLANCNENIPDVEGTRAAFETMKAELGEEVLKERALPEFSYTNEQMFFVAAAQLFCDKNLNDHKYLAAYMQDKNAHSSGNVRVNGIAMQMTEFADAFHCQQGDPMVTDKKEKCYLLPAV